MIKVFEREFRQLKEKIAANEDTSDIERKIRQTYKLSQKQTKQTVICTLFLSLFRYNYEGLRRQLCKCVMLEPMPETTEAERKRLLAVLWASVQGLLGGDYSLLFDELNRIIEANRLMEDEGESLPFV